MAASYEPIIGLEVHVQLKTKSKMFCSCDNRDDQPPNTAICPICTGQPGALPLPNKQAVEWSVMSAMALGCSINQESKFDRKNYFYPDLPKGYQISQFDKPFGYGGAVTIPIDGHDKTFRIHRLHLEEDAGKLIHAAGQDATLVDLNRAGTPLMEIVSEPDFRSPAEAKAYLQELQLVMRYLGISDADMEKGHLRCDANISLRPIGDKKLYTKTEIKNLNSFKAVERALAYEIERQTGLWEDGHPPTVGATRGWNENTGKTEEQRTKEEEADYRYFPEPDIPPIVLSDALLDQLRQQTPELPRQRRERLIDQYGISADLANQLVSDPPLADYFEEVMSEYQADLEKFDLHHDADKQRQKVLADFAAKWLINKLTLTHRSEHLISAQETAWILWMTKDGRLNQLTSLKVYEYISRHGGSAENAIQALGAEQVHDENAIGEAVAEIIKAHANVVADVKAGKTAALQFLVGQVMKATEGKANPQAVRTALQKALGL